MRSTPFLLSLFLSSFAAAEAGEPETPPPPAAVYEPAGLFYAGYASIPWHAAFSPDSKRVAVVEGYMQNRVSVYDASARTLEWRGTPEKQPASYRPAFSRNGSKLFLVEGTDLVVRERDTKGWPAVRRIPLGFDPGVNMFVRTVGLSRDESEAVLCQEGRAHRVPLLDAKKTTASVGVDDVVAASYRAEGGLRVSRWSERVVQTVFVVDSGPPVPPLAFAVLASSPDDKTWLVARTPRAPFGDGALSLDLVDAATREKLASVEVEADSRSSYVIQAEFSPDGKHLLLIESLRQGSVREARTGRLEQRILEYAGDRMIGMAVSPDGQYLLTGGRRAGEDVQEKAVLLWRLRGR